MRSMKGKAVLKELNADEDCDTENKEVGIDRTFTELLRDVTKTGNGEWGMGNGEWGMG